MRISVPGSPGVRRTAATAALLTLVLLAPLAAQERAPTFGARPGWMPRRVSFDGDITAAQKAEAVRNLEAIHGIFMQVPEIADPQGVTAEVLFSGGSRPPGADGNTDLRNVLEYRYDLGLCDPSYESGGCGTITVYVNFSNPPGSHALDDARGRQFYVEEIRSDGYFTSSYDTTLKTRDTIPSATELYYRLSPTEQSWVKVFFIPQGERYWTPVTREELYDAVLLDWERKSGGRDLSELRQRAGASPYQEWLAGAAQRKKEREEALAALAAFKSPTELAQARKELEETERQVGEQLKASEADHKEEAGKELDAMVAQVDSTRAELARMTPAERRMPAMIDQSRKDVPQSTGYPITDHESPWTMRMFALNHDFWHYCRSPVEVHGIEVEINASAGGGPPPPSVHRILWAAFKELDWPAFRRLLDTPTGSGG